jgi:predicted SnoaL-like aldol condensation-catalyzing enzyme
MKKLGILALIIGILFSVIACNASSSSTEPELSNIEKAKAVLLSLASGKTEAIKNYVSESTYIQHNLNFPDGRQVLIDAIEAGQLDGTTVEIHRALEEGNLVVLHTKYFFMGKDQVGFDIFRFENGKIVEHWDNLQEIVVETTSGRTQWDGPKAVLDIDKTASNKELVENFISDILMGANPDKITDYISTEQYDQHNPSVADGLDGLGAALAYFAENGLVMQYDTLHKVVANGNFVLSVSEGIFGTGDHVAYYDLFRVENGKIVEHWDTIETIPAQESWANSNGKF